MGTEAWFRNPDNYIRECVEVGATNLAWDRGYVIKKSVDPSRLADLYFPAAIDYRLLLVGDQGTAELRRGRDITNPVAVYPTWEYGEDVIELLAEQLANPLGENEEACADDSVPVDERPVLGQEHRVVIIRPPVASTGLGKRFYRTLKELQEEFPETIIHVHGVYSYRVLFGMGFRSVDIEPRTLAKRGAVTLPSGKEVSYEIAARTPQWVTLLGFEPVDLKIPRNRCMYNMKSAMWAAEHFREDIKFRVSPTGHTADSSSAVAVVPKGGKTILGTAKPVAGDKFLCDTCSLQDNCKYFRSGGVCSIPGSEPANLAKLFKSRDAETIIDGLGTLLATQANRLDRGLEDEEIYGELDPEVSKIMDSIFDRAVKLAKLLNPALASGPKVGLQVNFGGGTQEVAASNPKAMVAAVVRELTNRGVPREDITPAMIMKVLDPDSAAAVEAAAVEINAG